LQRLDGGSVGAPTGITVVSWQPSKRLGTAQTLGHSDLIADNFRSSVRHWVGETSGHSHEVIEHALAHSLADPTEATDPRGDYLEKRRALVVDRAVCCFAARAVLKLKVRLGLIPENARPIRLTIRQLIDRRNEMMRFIKDASVVK